MSFDAFISYSSKDKVVADALCARLEAAGIRCWIAPRDVLAGTSYGEAIIDAIHAAKVMVLVFSSNANTSGHIPKEVERAVSKGLAILPFRIEDVAPGRSLDYFIGSVHWLDAMTPPLEKHLDDLVATVQKLLPVKIGEDGAEATQTSGVLQRNTPTAAPTPSTAHAAAARTSPQAASASSSKAMWIGIAAVALLAVIVAGAMSMRGGHNSQNAGNLPAAPVAPDSPTPASSPNPPANPVAPSPAPAAKSGTDAIVGCYQWFNNQPVVIHADGTMQGGPFPGHWRKVSASGRSYTFTWPEATDTVTIAANQQYLSGANQYGYATSGTRMAGTTGLIGVWRWPNGVPVTVSPDGSFTAATFRGRWQATEASRGVYTLTWPSPVDSVTLSPDGTHVAGSNQYGVAISGMKTEPCSGN